MKKHDRTINLTPGDVELEWAGDEPVLRFLEYRDGALIRVKVKVGRYVGGTIARRLHEAQQTIERRASELLRALRGS